MPIKTTPPPTFPSLKPYAGATLGRRAYADVRLVGPTRIRSSVVQCMVDTGSDYTILPLGLAGAVGIVPSGGLVSITTVAGTSVSLSSHSPVDLEIEGYAISLRTVLFSPFSTVGGFIPILGRPELIAAFDFGFTVTDWHWG
jgi:hypothetical protein